MENKTIKRITEVINLNRYGNTERVKMNNLHNKEFVIKDIEKIHEGEDTYYDLLIEIEGKELCVYAGGVYIVKQLEKLTKNVLPVIASLSQGINKKNQPYWILE